MTSKTTGTFDIYKCPECGGDACDLECPDCFGLGEIFIGDDVGSVDDYEYCDSCGGEGTIYGEFECDDCGHTYSESDIDYS